MRKIIPIARSNRWHGVIMHDRPNPKYGLIPVDSFKLPDKIQKLITGEQVYQIIALKEVPRTCGTRIERGTLGGYVLGFTNLLQDGKCWINEGGYVFGKFLLQDDATVHEGGICYGAGWAMGGADISGEVTNASISNATVLRGAKVIGDPITELERLDIFDGAVIGRNTKVSGYAKVSGRAHIWSESGSVCIEGHTEIHATKTSEIIGNVAITGNSRILGEFFITAESKGRVHIGYTELLGCTDIHRNKSELSLIGGKIAAKQPMPLSHFQSESDESPTMTLHREDIRVYGPLFYNYNSRSSQIIFAKYHKNHYTTIAAWEMVINPIRFDANAMLFFKAPCWTCKAIEKRLEWHQKQKSSTEINLLENFYYGLKKLWKIQDQ
jgi:hypothetical protein